MTMLADDGYAILPHWTSCRPITWSTELCTPCTVRRCGDLVILIMVEHIHIYYIYINISVGCWCVKTVKTGLLHSGIIDK